MRSCRLFSCAGSHVWLRVGRQAETVAAAASARPAAAQWTLLVPVADGPRRPVAQLGQQLGQQAAQRRAALPALRRQHDGAQPRTAGAQPAQRRLVHVERRQHCRGQVSAVTR